MRKMTFTLEDEDLKVTHEIDQTYGLDSILDAFKNFLLGCGYVVSGQIEVVEREED